MTTHVDAYRVPGSVYVTDNSCADLVIKLTSSVIGIILRPTSLRSVYCICFLHVGAVVYLGSRKGKATGASLVVS